jgi:hypothetical protein
MSNGEPRSETLSDIPDSEVNQVVGDYESEGATVTKTKQSDGTWTVIAKWG